MGLIGTLQTTHLARGQPQLARRKLDRLLAVESATNNEAKRAESFRELAERFYARRIEERPDARSTKQDLASLRRYALPLIGHMDALAIQPS